MKKNFKILIISGVIILFIIALTYMSVLSSNQKKEITNLEEQVNYITWEKEYLNWALEDALKQY